MSPACAPSLGHSKGILGVMVYFNSCEICPRLFQPTCDESQRIPRKVTCGIDVSAMRKHAELVPHVAAKLKSNRRGASGPAKSTRHRLNRESVTPELTRSCLMCSPSPPLAHSSYFCHGLLV